MKVSFHNCICLVHDLHDLTIVTLNFLNPNLYESLSWYNLLISCWIMNTIIFLNNGPLQLRLPHWSSSLGRSNWLATFSAFSLLQSARPIQADLHYSAPESYLIYNGSFSNVGDKTCGNQPGKLILFIYNITIRPECITCLLLLENQ